VQTLNDSLTVAGGSYGNVASPAYWSVWGHSYMQHGFGPRLQTGRIDAFFRASIPIGYGDFANWAITGARLSIEGQSQGGWARMMNNILQQASSTGPSGPSVNQGGAHLLAYGINDLGNNGDTTQYDTAYQHAMRAVISRCRMSYLRPNNWAGAAGTGVITYGAGFSNVAVTGEFSTGLTLRQATSTTSATITYTIPSDYNGETITWLFVGNPGIAGGTFTFSGTAGVTGTVVTSNLMPSASLNHSPICRRITGLTAANAGQTIIATLTQIDSGATVYFDSIWAESLQPQPVIVCNTARLLSNGYSSYPQSIGDSNVATFNTYLTSVVTEFDGMVQIADIDTAINKDATALIYDGLHPNELGAARCSDAINTALAACNTPTSRYGLTSNRQSSSPRYAQDILIHRSGLWHAPICANIGGASGTNDYTPAAGDMWALPFMVTSGIRRATQWSMETLGTSTAATTVWFALYDDRGYSGYPQVKYVDSTPSAAVSLSTAAAVFNSSTTSGNAGYISQPLDPGLYWLVITIGTVSTPGHLRALLGPNPYMPNLGTGGGALAASQCPMAWKLTGQSNASQPKTFPSGAVATALAPMIGVKLV
jgi:hypothetical protein